MKIFITGGTGFIGQELVSHLLLQDHEITILTRYSQKAQQERPELSYVIGNPTKRGPWQKILERQDAVINLAGVSIFRQWTQKTKRAILNSRIQTTQRIIEAFYGKGKLLLSGSAVGYYGFHEEKPLDESCSRGKGFLASIASKWEEEAQRASEFGIRVILCRSGVVLGKRGGVFVSLLKLFRNRFGSRLGDGRQWFSWIHVKDLCDAFSFLISQTGIEGPVNITAPNPVTNREMTEALNHILGKRPILPRMPKFGLRILLGEFSETLIKGQRVYPQKLLDHGFSFAYPEIQEAIQNLLNL